jgi:antitoxin StbD
MEQLLADASISISELKKNPRAAIEAADGFPVAVLNRNRPSAYLVPAKAWAEMLERLDDIHLAELIRGRAAETPIPVGLDDL